MAWLKCWSPPTCRTGSSRPAAPVRPLPPLLQTLTGGQEALRLLSTGSTSSKDPQKVWKLATFFRNFKFFEVLVLTLSLSNLCWRVVYDEECRSQGEVSPFIHMDLSRRTAEEILDKFKDGTYLGKWKSLYFVLSLLVTVRSCSKTQHYAISLKMNDKVCVQ